jgi:hypothetical protein
MNPIWELVSDGEDGWPKARRMGVPGGWLYQVEIYEDITNRDPEQADLHRDGWHAPVFVPEFFQ